MDVSESVHTVKYYTCPPFVHQTHVITNMNAEEMYMTAKESHLCPEGYTQTSVNTLESGHVVYTCMGVIEDATVSAYCG